MLNYADIWVYVCWGGEVARTLNAVIFFHVTDGRSILRNPPGWDGALGRGATGYQ